MSTVPLVMVSGVLVATLSDDLEDTAALAFQSELAGRVVRDRATGVLLDISALELVDSFLSRVLSDTAAVARVLGARVAVVGMRPAVAITLVELGLPLTTVDTALSIDAGMRLLAAQPDARGERGGRLARSADHVRR